MTLRDLLPELNRIAASAHPLTDTNVDGVSLNGSTVAIECDTSDLMAERDEARDSEARLEKELKIAEDLIKELTARCERLTEMHEEFKDPQSGVTPATYRDRCNDAEQSRDRFRSAMVEAQRERDALRKRKGVTVALFRHENQVLRLLGDISRGAVEFTAAKTEAKSLLEKLRSP